MNVYNKLYYYRGRAAMAYPEICNFLTDFFLSQRQRPETFFTVIMKNAKGLILLTVVSI